MTKLQQVLFELSMDYIGHPYYVSGNAIYHALAAELDYDTAKHLRASHGIFQPGQFGKFPEEHSQNGTRPYLGTGLPDVESYEDLFLFRHPDHPWLIDSRPRDALNTHDLRVQGGHPALAYQTVFGKPDDHHKETQTTKWYIHAYLHADNADVLPLDEDVLDGLRFGGKRNYGYGETRLKDTNVVELDDLDYSGLEDAGAYLLEIMTPYVLESEYPDADNVPVPWWWKESRDDLRMREEKVLEQREAYTLQTVDHGQVVAYEGDTPIKTAINGITRVGTHSKYGFGELRVKPLNN